MSEIQQALVDADRLAARVETYADKALHGLLSSGAQADFVESAILLGRATSLVLAYHAEVVEGVRHLDAHARTCAMVPGEDPPAACSCGVESLLRKGHP